MEIEMKYALPGRECADEIWNDEQLNGISDLSSAEVLVMKAIYFDTEDHILTKNNVSVRVRAEGDHTFATLKWGGKQEDGLFSRQEVNVPVDPDISFMQLPSNVFALSEDGQKMLELVKDKPLINLFEMRFLRRRKKMSLNSSVMELAIDLGNIVSDKGEKPIAELEIELYAGKVEDIRAMGKLISEKYGLKVKTTSKFADGLSIE